MGQRLQLWFPLWFQLWLPPRLADVPLVFEETGAVTAPEPSPGPLATGTVVTEEKLLAEVTELLAVDAIVADPDAVVEDPEVAEDPEDAEDEEPDEELDEPPSIAMLCHDPDKSVYTYLGSSSRIILNSNLP